MKNETHKKIGEWLVKGNTGMSSMYLAALILGAENVRISYPYDPADFNRCVKLCDYIGFSLVDAMAMAAEHSEHWKQYAMHLPQLQRLYKEECVGDIWSAPKLYKFMTEIQKYADDILRNKK